MSVGLAAARSANSSVSHIDMRRSRSIGVIHLMMGPVAVTMRTWMALVTLNGTEREKIPILQIEGIFNTDIPDLKGL